MGPVDLVSLAHRGPFVALQPPFSKGRYLHDTVRASGFLNVVQELSRFCPVSAGTRSSCPLLLGSTSSPRAPSTVWKRKRARSGVTTQESPVRYPESSAVVPGTRDVRHGENRVYCGACESADHLPSLNEGVQWQADSTHVEKVVNCCFRNGQKVGVAIDVDRKRARWKRFEKKAANELDGERREGYRSITPTAHQVAADRPDLQHATSIHMRTLETPLELQEM